MRCIRFMRSISQIWGILMPRIRGIAMQRLYRGPGGTFLEKDAEIFSAEHVPNTSHPTFSIEIGADRLSNRQP